jgi:hypothetical protein
MSVEVANEDVNAMVTERGDAFYPDHVGDAIHFQEQHGAAFQPRLYVPRPLAVSALQITETNAAWVASWVNGTYQEDNVFDRAAVRFCDYTGKMRWADIGWWVFELSSSEGFDAKSNIWFEANYMGEPMCADCETPIRTHEVLCD